ncbi:putative nuclease HARBI1 [Montipora capricornis]|uniref:putative nuclease HARBI1 n=1 Tax=Montipora capricornis TaxID=246305 RepID=UPI0035F186DA
MAAVGALLTPNREKRKYRQRTVLTGMRRCEVLTALRYFASGSFLKVVADTMGISKASASRCVHSFTQCLKSIAGEWIIFPTSREGVNETMTKFYSIGAFPKVMGAIDGTLIPIRAPAKEEHLYVYHKGFHAINVMAVCDAEMRFTNIVAKWHGSVHDSAIFNGSALQTHMETKQQEGCLLGDRGYALQSYLMTPLNPDKVSSAAEEMYQRIHTRTRNVIERSFGLLKQRFRCLDFSGGTMQFSPCRCCDIIVAIVVLHNMCIHDNTQPDGLDVTQLNGSDDRPMYSAQNWHVNQTCKSCYCNSYYCSLH